MAAPAKWYYNHAMPIIHLHSFFAQWGMYGIVPEEDLPLFYGDEFASVADH